MMRMSTTNWSETCPFIVITILVWGVAHITSVSGQCPSQKWHHFETKCYFAQSVERTYENMDNYCKYQVEGGSKSTSSLSSSSLSSLVIINSEAENQFITNRVLQDSNCLYLLGAILKESSIDTKNWNVNNSTQSNIINNNYHQNYNQNTNYVWHDKSSLRFSNLSDKVSRNYSSFKPISSSSKTHCSRLAIRKESSAWEEAACNQRFCTLCQTYISLSDVSSSGQRSSSSSSSSSNSRNRQSRYLDQQSHSLYGINNASSSREIIDGLLKIDTRTTENFLKIEQQIASIISLHAADSLRANQTLMDEIQAIHAKLNSLNLTILNTLTNDIQELKESLNETQSEGETWKSNISTRFEHLENRLQNSFELLSLALNHTKNTQSGQEPLTNASKPSNFTLELILKLYETDDYIQNKLFHIQTQLFEVVENISSIRNVLSPKVKQLEIKVDKLSREQRMYEEMSGKSRQNIISVMSKLKMNFDNEVLKLRSEDGNILKQLDSQEKTLKKMVSNLGTNKEDSSGPMNVDQSELERKIQKLESSLRDGKDEVGSLWKLQETNEGQIKKLTRELDALMNKCNDDRKYFDKQLARLNKTHEKLLLKSFNDNNSNTDKGKLSADSSSASNTTSVSVVILIFTLCALFFFVLFVSIIVCTRKVFHKQRSRRGTIVVNSGKTNSNNGNNNGGKKGTGNNNDQGSYETALLKE